MDPDSRVDLFISFHGSETLPPGFKTRELAAATENEVRTRANRLGFFPSIFFDGTNIRSEIDVLFDAVLQTRPGGVALFLLTSKFFSQAWCVAELRAFLKVHSDSHSHIKLRFVCLEPNADSILENQLVRTVVPKLSGFALRSDIPVTTVAETSASLAELVWKAWTRDDGDISPEHRPTILGRTRQDSLLALQRVFTEDDLPALRAKLGLPGNVTSVLDAFRRAGEDNVVNVHNVTPLYGVIILRNGATAEKQRHAVAAYERKWVHSNQLDWGSELRQALKDLYKEGRQYLETESLV